MATFSSFFIFFFFLRLSQANITTCPEASCSGSAGYLSVNFPFRLGFQRPRCGYGASFDLSCNSRNQTIIRFSSGEFAVRKIDYEDQSLWINDPEDCLARRFFNNEFHLSSTYPFEVDRLENYTFLRCPPSAMTPAISCLSRTDYSVVAVATEGYYGGFESAASDSPSPSPSPATSCSVMATALVPISARWIRWPDRFGDLSGDVRLTWKQPDCGECLARGGECGYQRGSDSKIGCSVDSNGSKHGLPRSAKYGIIIGIGIPGFICLIGVGCYICGKVRGCRRRYRPSWEYPDSTAPIPVVVIMGLDGPTIESFPKVQLGESKRLPKPSDNTCPICLSEYEPKDTLRTIPECNHYYHASCVDEWLKMNATCPLCRNSPDASFAVTPSSSVFSSSDLSSP
ncbi:hypothetical protein UlMin_042510 [Ulmus minor]